VLNAGVYIVLQQLTTLAAAWSATDSA